MAKKRSQDEVSGEEGREEDQAPEEEVGTATSRSSASLDVDGRVKRAGGCRLR